MENIVSQLPQDNVEASFLRSVLAVHNEKYEESAKVSSILILLKYLIMLIIIIKLLEHTRSQLDKSITALLAESYGRAYVPLVMVQQCSELEEIIEYKKLLRAHKDLEGHTHHDNINSVFYEDASVLRSRSRTDSMASTVPSRPARYQYHNHYPL
jgi:hypothetical protein